MEPKKKVYKQVLYATVHKCTNASTTGGEGVAQTISLPTYSRYRKSKALFTFCRKWKQVLLKFLTMKGAD